MGETTRGAKRLGGKRPGRKRLGGETTRGGNGLGAKRLGFSVTGFRSVGFIPDPSPPPPPPPPPHTHTHQHTHKQVFVKAPIDQPTRVRPQRSPSLNDVDYVRKTLSKKTISSLFEIQILVITRFRHAALAFIPDTCPWGHR